MIRIKYRNLVATIAVVVSLSACAPTSQNQTSDTLAGKGKPIETPASNSTSLTSGQPTKSDSDEVSKEHGDYVHSPFFGAIPNVETARADIERRVKQRRPKLDLTGMRFYEQRYTKDDLTPLSTPDAIDFVQIINLKSVGITDTELESFSRLKPFALWLTRNPVRDLHAISHMKTLTQLALDETQVDGKGMKVIGRLSNLGGLSLSETPIADRDLNELYQLKALTSLSLKGCPNISRSAVDKLKKMIPQCKVDY